MNQHERIWKELTTDIDLYKFYVDLLIKSGTFFFAINGGIATYFFTHTANSNLVKYSLILPFIVNAAVLVICAWNIGPAREMKRDFEKTCKEADFNAPYSMNLLVQLLWMFIVCYALIEIGLLIAFCKYRMFEPGL